MLPNVGLTGAPLAYADVGAALAHSVVCCSDLHIRDA
jgi:hypothetical protein